ncbi:hypothetical protein [Bacillus sp. Au-Bac7]|uniref:hypothetical protein n=1 Tax=Bacillus sp. Au-Bac7 TaxID=2906458 RepID=UPI001E6280E6|nr:hypothetical protein [Bacillus sp. Au-Bac7]MCE4052104.1 hypothetical protein [Bacillus sp. Au-Bac7]
MEANNDNFNRRFYLFKNKVINISILVIVIISCIGLWSMDLLTVKNFFFRIIPVSVFLFLLSPTIDYIFRWIAKKEDVDISIYPTTSTDVKKLKRELKFLESLRKNRLRIVSVNNKFNYVFAFGLILLSGVFLAISIGTAKYSNTVNWLSIFTFAIGIIQMVDTGIDNRLNDKINEIQTMLIEIREIELDNKVDKILDLIEKLQQKK